MTHLPCAPGLEACKTALKLSLRLPFLLWVIFSKLSRCLLTAADCEPLAPVDAGPLSAKGELKLSHS